MELELKKENLGAFETDGEVLVTQEETTETIVPDYCPDIARMIEATGNIMIQSRTLRDQCAEVTGQVQVSVLYTPEGESSVRTLHTALPFTLESDHPSFQNGSFLTAEVELETLETRLLNPRKLFIHCKLVGRLTGYRKQSVDICSDVAASEDQSLEKRHSRQHTILLSKIVEQDFPFTGEVTISSSRDGVAEILTSHVCSTVTETKIVGNKLILKGVFQVRFLYRSTGGRCCTTSAELPFSQIIDVEGDSEKAKASIRLELSDCQFQIENGTEDGREIQVNLVAHCTVFLREEKDLTLLDDLYSTVYKTTYETSVLPLTCFRETLERRQAVREVLEIGVIASEILAVSVKCGPVLTGREGETISLRTCAQVRVMYQDEGGVPLLAERSLEVKCQMELPEDSRLVSRALCPDEVQGSLAERGIEVRFSVVFQVEAERSVKCAFISHAELIDEAQKDLSSAPSVVLRCLGSHETLWDLGKRYNTTMSDILQANEMEDEEPIPRDKLLLIPRKRV